MTSLKQLPTPTKKFLFGHLAMILQPRLVHLEVCLFPIYYYAHRYYINPIRQKPDFEPDVGHVNSYRIIIGSRYIGNQYFYRAEKNTSSLSKSDDFDTDLQPDFLKICLFLQCYILLILV